MDRKPVFIGLLGIVFLSGIYFLFLMLIGGIEHALEFVSHLWYWLIIIIAGFGLQLGLYTFIRQRIKSRAATIEISTSVGVSTGAMVACCLHLAVELLPLIGLSALTLVLTAYQIPILLIGVFSNIIGVVFMISIIKKHNLYSKESKLIKIFQLNFKYVIVILFIIGIATITTTALTAEEKMPITFNLEEQTIKSNKVDFSVEPEIIPGNGL